MSVKNMFYDLLTKHGGARAVFPISLDSGETAWYLLYGKDGEGLYSREGEKLSIALDLENIKAKTVDALQNADSATVLRLANMFKIELFANKGEE